LIALIDARREVLSPELSLRAEKLRDCLAKLPPDQLASLNLYYTEEEPVETIALREGRTVDAIYKLLQRSRRVLLGCVERGMRTEGPTA
jgi:DNA-directed RNA polymerase specialized sigma24 family protein